MGVRTVFLLGFMGCGKSTVGQALARRLDWDFVDLDARIEAQEGQSVPEIFRLRGEASFRLAETNALRRLMSDPKKRHTIVALGGGAFVQEANRELLRGQPSVFLEATAEELWRRCLQDGIERPLRQDPDQFSRLYAERLPFYRQASVAIDTSGKELPSICMEIERALQLHGMRENESLSSS